MAEEKKEETITEDSNSPVSKELSPIIEAISKLNVLQLSELVKALEEKFGVTAALPMVNPVATAASNGEPVAATEEKDSYKVTLKSDGGNKIPVIKALRSIKSDLGLKEAKELIDEAPSVIEEGLEKEKAEEIKKVMEEAGAEIELS